MPLQVTMLGRTAVTLAWDPHPEAFAYIVRRVYREGDVQHDDARAVVYEGLYCDPGLEPATDYLFEVTSMADPDADEQPDEAVDQQRIRLRTPPELEYPTATAFFTDFVAPTFRRRMADQAARWCPRWAAHPEVWLAVSEMWHAYEAMRPPEPPQEPGKVRAEWLLQVAWPMLDRLAGVIGPMEDCHLDDDEGDRHVEPQPAGPGKVIALPDTPLSPLP